MPRWQLLAQAGAVPIARSSHTLAAIGERLYIFGGEHDPRVPVGSQLYAYALTGPEAGVWVEEEAQGEPSPRLGHAAAAVGDTLYIFGGRSGLAMGEGAMNDLHAYSAATRTWRQVAAEGPLPPKRSYHTMTVVGDKLYVFGGCAEVGRLNDLHEYDTAANRWRPLGAPPPEVVPPRGGSCLVPAPGGDGVMVVAGFCGRELDDAHTYSFSKAAWCGDACPTCRGATAATPPAPERILARSVFGAALHECGGGAGGEGHRCGLAGAVLAYGGEVDPSAKGHDGAGDFCDSLAALGGAASPASAGWREVPAGGDAPGPRGWFAYTPLPGGRLALHGGMDAQNQRLNDLYVLDPHAE